MLNEAKNAGIAEATARLFNEVQHKICRLQPFDDPPNKSNSIRPSEADRAAALLALAARALDGHIF